MKRRVLSFIIVLALCLDLCPVWGFAADAETGNGLCPHHLVHTDACGYAAPVLEQGCTHNHDAGCYTDGALTCPHEHDDACGYVPGTPGAPCTFVCRVCPIEDLLGRLPDSVSPDNGEQVQAQLDEIFALYDGLTEDEQQQVDLSPCVSLLDQIGGMGVALLEGVTGNSAYNMNGNETSAKTVSNTMVFNTNGNTLEVSQSGTNAITVTETGNLELTGGGTIKSQKAAGVEVQSGGSLRVTGSDINVHGMSYGVYIASDASAELSVGTYFGLDGAIKTADGNYAALLAPGCAFYDDSGAPILPKNMAAVNSVKIGQCTDHPDKSCNHVAGTTTHTWTCPYCASNGSEPCTFTFDENGTGTCACGNTLTIAVNETDLADLVYGGTIQPEDVTITFTLADGTVLSLTRETDYNANYVIHKDANTVTVTVTGVTFGGTFTKLYTVARQPVLAWDTNTGPIQINVDYDGASVEAGELPPVKINIENADELRGSLQYSHKVAGADNSAYTNGLPKDAGTYDVIVSLPQMENFEGAASEPITLTINKINPIVTAPVATQPIFNRSPQELVTAGTLCGAAVQDGVKVLFATSKNGTYTASIPTGTDAKDYEVWYKVDGSNNYNAAGPAQIENVTIQRKQITPKVTLSDYTYLYDGGEKQPKVTVKDASDGDFVLNDSEYQVTYQNNRNVGTAKVVVTDKPGGNYAITEAAVEFQITRQPQAALTITKQPDTVTYGDKFTLGTTGGSGNGVVTWKITAGENVAEVNASGQVTIIGDGKATVQATKSGQDPQTGNVNYEDATATWEIDAAKKPVTATITAEDKTYDGDVDATVHAEVKEGILPGDEITITDLTGTFDNANAGEDKTVTVVTTGAKITGKNSEHYDVSYSSTTVKATIHKAVAKITTPPVPASLTYNGTAQALIGTSAVVDPADVPVEYSLSETGPYTTDFPKGTNAGTYPVWYRVQETPNYTGLPPASVDVTIAKKPVSPTIALDQDTFVYDGTPKEPVVTLTEADGTILDTEYTVEYSNNINYGTATVTVTAKADGNYTFENAPVTAAFTITQKKAEVLTAPEALEPLTYNTKAQNLVTAGTASGGTMVYALDGENGNYQEAIPIGTNAGRYTVHYKVRGDSNHIDSEVGSLTVTIDPKVVNNPTIELFDENNNSPVSYTYDGNAKTPTVVVKDGSTDIDANEYNVVYSNNTDAGKATVSITDKLNGNYTVTGSTEFVIQKADIVFNPAPEAADITYDGKPHELLTPGKPNGGTIQYVLGSPNSTFADAIPTGVEAGNYTVYYKVIGDKNYNDFAAASVTVEIKKAAAAITKAPAGINPLTYNRQPQPLVTAGETNVGFLVYSLDGTNFSPEIPTGTNAGTYNIYYKVDETANYTGVDVNETPISVTIAPKAITPKVELSESSYTYDRTKKNPKITVKDGAAVIGDDQYTVTWNNDLTSAGTHIATIKSTDNGNYSFTATAEVEIIAALQNELEITNKRDHVYYGDVFTLDTSSGSIDGTVKWSVTEGNATIEEGTGKLTITGTGSVTVKAVRTVPNYGPVSDAWTFTVEPKQVEAVVTVTEKVYDGTTVATVTATVKAGDLVNLADSITLSGLTGAYDNANAGTGKTVTLNDTGAIKLSGDGKYIISYPATAQGDIKPKGVTVTVTLSDHDLKTETVGDATTYSYDYDGTEKRPSVTVTAQDNNAELASSDYEVSYSNNKNVGTAAVTVKEAAGGNYTFNVPPVTFEIKHAAAVLTSTPQAKDLTYEKGTQQELVTVGTATGGTVVYSSTGADGSYSEAIPTGENAGTYTVYYKVRGDANHVGTGPSPVTVTIKPKEITPTITLSQDSYVYDGNECKPAVTVKDGVDAADAIAASEYAVFYRDNINAGTATVIISNNNGGNYIVNGTATFEITKIAPTVKAPEGKTGLQYNGELQELVNAGVCNEGTVQYSVNGGNYSTAIPTASAVGEYEIKYKVIGDANHSDTGPVTLANKVEIAKNTVTKPTISLSSDTFTYTGSQQKPTIIVYDDHSRLIPEHEYTVTITGTKGNNMVDVDTYTVTVKTPDTSNYVIDTNNTRTFKIVPAGQETISITGTKTQVNYGDVIQLGTTGGVGGSTVKWEITGNTSTTLTQNGLLTVKDVGGPITVTVTRSKDNYTDVSTTWEFTAAKKRVTAEVTVAAKNYDSTTDVANTAITATVKAADLAFTGDSITITGLTGTYDNAAVGTDKTVTLTGGTVGGTNADKYDVTIPATVTASILAVPATVDTPPEAVSPLTYNASQSQALVTSGTATGGIMVYSLDGKDFTPSIPKAKDAGTYTVWYKAQGDQNHTDSAVGTVDVTINKQTVEAADLQIELSPPSGQYDGNVQQPKVTLRDKANNVIPESEYKITYVTDGGKNWKDQGTYTVKVENITGGNYEIKTATKDFVISTTAQAPLEIVNKPGKVYYGDTFTLSTSGGSSSAAVTWSSDPAGIVEIDANGFVKIVGVGSTTITATKEGGGNYDTATATYPLNALKKSITAIVTAEDREYKSGDATATIHITWKPGDLVGADKIDTTGITGAFADEKVGTNKTVTITGTPVSDATSQKYDITIPASTTASITKATATAPTLTAGNRVYDGTAQPLVSGGNDGVTLYSTSRDGVYSATVPTGTNAKTYTVWYKEQGDTNHTDSEPQAIEVTISPKTLTLADANVTVELSGNDLQKADDGTYYYTYDGTEKKPTVTIKDGAAEIPAGEYTVTYVDNKNVSTADKKATVTITDNEGGNYTVSGSTTFEIRAGSAQLTSSPKANDLTYTGAAQQLVTVGTATGGHIEYKDPATGNFSTNIPTATNAGAYTVDYKVVGDDNHTDGPTGSVTVTIQPKTVISPKITVTDTYTYDGTEQKPTGTAVTVEDGSTTIPDTEYTLSYQNNVNAGTATVIVTDNNGGNYTVNGTATFQIGKAAAAVGTPPEGKTGLHYSGSAQELLDTPGTATGGTMVYSLSETGEYSAAIPTGKAVGEYEIWYKVQGDANHSDSAAKKLADAVQIAINTVADPLIQVTPESVTYNGKKQEPTVTVKADGLTIDGSEYTVTYVDTANSNNADLIQPGTYTVTVTGKDTNYSFTKTAEFTILPADQTPLTITGIKEQVRCGDTIPLATNGGSSGGTVTWTVSDESVAEITDAGLLTVKGVGNVTVTATCKKTGYADQTATWPFHADKKPITAIVTAADRAYTGGTEAALSVTWTPGDLLTGDNIETTDKLTGAFTDPNAGIDKTVKITGTLTHEKYDITVPAATTASISKVEITDDKVSLPVAEDAANLVYTGQPLPLVKAGSAEGGAMEYSTDGETYSTSLPTGTDAGDYEVWYRVKGDGNHNDTAGKKLDSKVTIARQTVTNPTIEFTPNEVSYNGQVQKPTVTVKDANARVIPGSEYTIGYGTSDWKAISSDVVKHEVTVTDKAGGNYTITEKTAEFKILPAGQDPLSIVNQPGTVRYGTNFTLSTSGGSGAGTVTWQSSDTSVATIDQNGLVKVQKAGGPVTITATRTVEGHTSATATWSFSAEKKPVTAIVTAEDRVYDTTDRADLVITWNPGDVLSGDSIDLSAVLTGTFNNANAGDNKTVTIKLKDGSSLPDGGGKYAVSYNNTTRASITPAPASVTAAPTPLNPEYSGKLQNLVSAGSATNGTITYSLDGIVYGPNLPQGKNAGSYTVWYKVTGNENYKDVAPAVVPAAIQPKEVNSPKIELSPSSFEYDGTAKKPDVVVKDGNTVIPVVEYTVSYSDNTDVGAKATVTITDNEDGNYIVSGEAYFTITAGAASLKDAPKPYNLTYNGFEQELVTEGTAVNGQVVYAESKTGSYSTSIPMKADAGTYQVWYKVQGANGAADTTPKQLFVTIRQKEVTPVIRIGGRSSYSVAYNGSAQEPDITVYVESKEYSDLYYTVEYDGNDGVGTAEVTVTSTGGNYQFLAFKTFTITKGKAAFASGGEPVAKTGLVYTGEPLDLVEEGIAEDVNSIVVYSLDRTNYSPLIPTGINRGSYTVYAKVQGNEFYEDSTVVVRRVTIGVNTLSAGDLTVTLPTTNFPYTGGEVKPTVTVTDNVSGNVIDSNEYTMTYTNNVNVGTATVSIKSKTTGNYSFTTSTTFQIVDASQTPLTITGKKDTVCYGDTLYLGTSGGVGADAVTWSVTDGSDVVSITQSGVVEIKKSGSVTITATKGEATDTWTFYAQPKPVTAVVTAANKTYDNSNTATLTVTINGLIPGDSIDSDAVTATGHFMDENAETNKTVIITGLTIPDGVKEKYKVTSYNTTATASITPKPASVTTAPTLVTGLLTYNGSAQPLLSNEGTAADGNMVYSLDGRNYTYTIPTGTDAKTYTVWYKVEATDENHKDSAPVKLGTVTITPSSDTDVTQPATPDSIFMVPASTPAPNAASTPVTNAVSAPIQAIVENGAASTVVSSADGDKLVQEAVENQSESIVIKPEITGEVTKAQVSIPASTVNQIKSETNASLTVSAPMADVTIPQAALETLSGAGGDVEVVTEQVDQTLVLTLTADGEKVESVPGGVTLTVPAEDAGPGTVAVLVREDGTREVIPKSVAEDGKVSIPLNGSATIEIVDNSKTFDDVPAESWEADAAAFVSARELFGGTGETTFSPNETLSRGMLAEVLYRLEGSPKQEAVSGFTDVDGDAWYANGVAWAAEQGIALGDGDGQFRPEERITREQFAVMLWKYAGSPKAESDQALDFEDAAKVSDYAVEALRWAVEKGIMGGTDDRRLIPEEKATRIEAAQMLKNFLENT